jgi:ankyrin repeat protein
MNNNRFIFYPVTDIDNYIIGFIDPIDDFITLSRVNKYYNKLVTEKILFVTFKKFTLEMRELNKQKNFQNACEHGYILVAQYFFNKNITDIHVDNEYAFRHACRNNHTEIVKWLYQLGINICSPINIHVDNEFAFKYFCRNGDMEMAKWLYQLSEDIFSPINIHIDNDQAFALACQSGKIEMAEWLLQPHTQKVRPGPWRPWLSNKISSATSRFSKENHDFRFREKSVSRINIHANDEMAFVEACGNGHMGMAKWLFQLSINISSPINIHTGIEKVFAEACTQGHTEIAKWLFQLGLDISSPINIHAHGERAFGWACGRGQIETAKWLFQLGLDISSPINIHGSLNLSNFINNNFSFDDCIDDEKPFEWACSRGYLETAKWLFQLGIDISSPINIHIDNEKIFKKTCSEGQIEVAKWLYQLGIDISSPINIHDNYEEAFRDACRLGHVKTAKWLFQLGNEISSPIDICVHSDFAFKNACLYRHTEIIEWLCLLCNKYNFTVSANNTITYHIEN